MGRLIDADELIGDLTYAIETMIEENEDDKYGKYLEGNINFSEIVEKIIERQRTVYDIDRIIEQLQEQKENALEKSMAQILPHKARPYLEAHNSFDKAIEIVKAGGIDE